MEDTAFYRWNRFVALNEVGGEPDRFGVPPAEFHAAAAARVAGSPAAMTTLSTHDTKRSEDVRARLAVLSELPGTWAESLRRWVARHPLPERTFELLAWQNLVGAWPISAERMRDYLRKASREAKLVTSHVEPVPAVDDVIAGWPSAVLDDPETVAEIEEFVARIAPPGWSNSLGQKLLQLAGPGVPDVYQGTELFEYSLVDPDNRRPVDFAARRSLLARLDAGSLPAGRRVRFGEAAGDLPGAAAAPESSRAVLRLPPAAGAGARRGARDRRSPAPPTWSRWPPGCRSGSPPAVAGPTPCCRCPAARPAGPT